MKWVVERGCKQWGRDEEEKRIEDLEFLLGERSEVWRVTCGAKFVEFCCAAMECGEFSMIGSG